MERAACLAATLVVAVALHVQNEDLAGAVPQAAGLPDAGKAAPAAEAWPDEDSCQLFSGRGLELSCDVHPEHPRSDADTLLFKLTGAGARSSMSHYVEEMRSHGDGASVFVTTTALPAFVQEVLPQVTNTFKLVTGDADKGPAKVLRQDEFERLANDTRVLRWFAVNCVDGEDAHPKVVPIPIGLDYHSLKTGSTRWGSQASPQSQERTLLDVRHGAPPFAERDSKVFMCGAYSSRARERAIGLLRAQPELVEYHTFDMQRQEFWEAVAKHRFSASPPGNGIDCHRTWEIIALGGIPLVDPSLQKLYEGNGFNVVLLEVDEWENLSDPTVQVKMQKAAARQEDSGASGTLPPAMYLKYWVDRVRGS